MENLYNHPSVKQFIQEVDNPSFENTQINLRTRTIIDGGSGAGKTNALMHYIMRSPNTFEQIVVVNRGVEEPFYECLRKGLEKKGKITFFTPENYPDAQELFGARENDKDEYLVIFDDMIGDLQNKHAIAKLTKYFIFGRKLHMTVFFLTQAYFKVPKEVRLQANYLILLRLNSSRDLKIILSDLTLGVTKDQLVEMYRICTSGKFNFLKINVDSTDGNEKFTRNFTDEFKVEEYMDEKGEMCSRISAGPWYRPSTDYAANKRKRPAEVTGGNSGGAKSRKLSFSPQ